MRDVGSSESEQQRALIASRRTGERSIETALAEIQIIKHNIYVDRKERSLSEVRVFGLYHRLRHGPCSKCYIATPQEEIPVCSCLPPVGDKKGCLDDCVNRAVRFTYCS